MTRRGHQIFAEELAGFAAGHADPRVTAIAERAAAPLGVLVCGRGGVGRSTVAHALDRAGGALGITATIGATPPTCAGDSAPALGEIFDEVRADVVVYVTAEVVKPEDIDAIGTAGRPVLAVLNKADLAGSLSGRAGDEPMVAARMRCADLSALVGVPMEPMIGLLAVAALDDLDGALWAALRVLAADPGGATCLDGSFAGFLDADVAVPTDVRLRLLDTLDLLGTALGIAAVQQGRTPAQLRALLRRMSGVDAVLTAVAALGAEVRYQRMLEVVAELEALAVGQRDLGDSISGFLSCDDTVVARMAVAVDLAEAAGLGPTDLAPGNLDRDDPAAHLPRAVHWQRYSLGRLGPVSDLHRACGTDIARGSLRLWSQTCGSLPGESW
jgi:hypothetical protein